MNPSPFNPNPLLCSVNDLRGFEVEASDGLIGSVVNLYFDDSRWTIRSLIVESGDWLARRQVFVSPVSVLAIDHEHRTISTSLTRDRVRGSPDIDTDKPISRQHEVEQYGYYGYPFYWGGSGLWGEGMQPGMMLSAYTGSLPDKVAQRQRAFVEAQAAFHRERGDNPHLRSCLAIEGYHLHACDGDIGHVEDVLVDEQTWAIRYLVVKTSDWWFGRHVLVAPRWVDDISWLEATVSVGMSRQAIKDAPRFDPDRLPDRAHEAALHRHHDRPGYWTEADRLETDISRD